MNRILIAAAAVVALSGAASAMSSDTFVDSRIHNYAPGVDVSTLTDAQKDAIRLTISSGDSASEKRAFVRSIVNG